MLDDAWFDSQYGYKGFSPFARANGSPSANGSGPFDLTKYNEAFWDHTSETIEMAASYGFISQVKVQPTYYAWDYRKQGALWVPDYNSHPRRYNIQGEKLGSPDLDDDGHFFIASDGDVYGNALIKEMMRRYKAYIDAGQLYFCTALEMAQKSLHEDTLRRIVAENGRAIVICNRQEYGPGQWRNMVRESNPNMHGNEEHGKDNLQAFLAEFLDDNEPQRRTEMLTESKAYNAKTVFLNSDGCRLDGEAGKDPWQTYNYAALEEIAVYMLREHGSNWTHQSVSKMPPFAWGRVDFGPMDRNELPMLRRIAQRIGR